MDFVVIITNSLFCDFSLKNRVQIVLRLTIFQIFICYFCIVQSPGLKPNAASREVLPLENVLFDVLDFAGEHALSAGDDFGPQPAELVLDAHGARLEEVESGPLPNGHFRDLGKLHRSDGKVPPLKIIVRV